MFKCNLGQETFHSFRHTSYSLLDTADHLEVANSFPMCFKASFLKKKTTPQEGKVRIYQLVSEQGSTNLLWSKHQIKNVGHRQIVCVCFEFCVLQTDTVYHMPPLSVTN